MGKRLRNLDRRELVDASRALARHRGCTCARPVVHVLRLEPPPHVSVTHAPGCPMVGHESTYDLILAVGDDAAS